MEIQITKKERENYGGTIVSPSGVDLLPKPTDSVEYTRLEKEKLASLLNLNGTNYVMVYGTGTPTENAAELQAAYDAAKNMPRYLGELSNIMGTTQWYKGQTYWDSAPDIYWRITENETTSNVSSPLNVIEITEQEAKYGADLKITEHSRFSILVSPGRYDMGKGFIMDAPFIDLVGIGDGVKIYNSMMCYQGDLTTSGWAESYLDLTYPNPPVWDTSYMDLGESGGDGDMEALRLQVDNIHISNIEFTKSAVKQLGLQPNTIFKNCKSGKFAFSGVGYLATASTYIDCEGDTHCFEYGDLEGTYINCKALSASFGSTSFNGYAENCSAEGNSFAPFGAGFNGMTVRCSASDNSFGGSGGGIREGATILYCTLSNDVFETPLSGAKMMYNIDASSF